MAVFQNYISGPVDFPTTTDYHWSKFDVNASQKNGKHEVVQGPFQFGLADKLDKNDKEVRFCNRRIFSCRP